MLFSWPYKMCCVCWFKYGRSQSPSSVALNYCHSSCFFPACFSFSFLKKDMQHTFCMHFWILTGFFILQKTVTHKEIILLSSMMKLQGNRIWKKGYSISIRLIMIPIIQARIYEEAVLGIDKPLFLFFLFDILSRTKIAPKIYDKTFFCLFNLCADKLN